MIADYIPIGRANAIPGRILAARIGANIRTITQQIESERRQGIPICATSDPEHPGYYIAETDEELFDFCARLDKRAAELRRTSHAMVSVLDAPQNPERLN